MSAPEAGTGPRTTVAGGGTVAPCCAEPGNRVAEPHPTDPATWTVERCTVCHRRHITLHADPADWLGHSPPARG